LMPLFCVPSAMLWNIHAMPNGVLARTVFIVGSIVCNAVAIFILDRHSTGVVIFCPGRGCLRIEKRGLFGRVKSERVINVCDVKAVDVDTKTVDSETAAGGIEIHELAIVTRSERIPLAGRR